MGIQKKLKEKWQEALQAVLPIICIVLTLCFSIAPVSPSILLCFLMGAVLILAGMMFFTLGAEISMTPMGERVGSSLTQSRNLFLIVILSFLLGLIITISEPDLQVLAGQVPAVPSIILILSVACGVGVFLVIALLRMLFSVPLPPLLIAFYVLIFALSAFVPKDFLNIAFDSGGVTTGMQQMTALAWWLSALSARFWLSCFLEWPSVPRTESLSAALGWKQTPPDSSGFCFPQSFPPI